MCRTYLVQKVSWMNKEQLEHLESGVWRAVEARRKERMKSKSNGGRQSKGRNKASKASNAFPAQNNIWGRRNGKRRRTRSDGRTTEVRTGRGHAGLVPGEDELRGLDKTSGKGKGKGNGGKGEHEGKGGGFGRKGFQQSVREEKEERVRMAPNMGAGGSHPQATSDLGEREIEEKRETRG